jgi:hypothetical protein
MRYAYEVLSIRVGQIVGYALGRARAGVGQLGSFKNSFYSMNKRAVIYFLTEDYLVNLVTWFKQDVRVEVSPCSQM